MNEITVKVPPLPVKTRRAPPRDLESTTVFSTSIHDDIYNFQDTETNNRTNHVVKIRINPSEKNPTVICDPVIPVNNLSPCIRISVNSETTMAETATPNNNPYFYYPFISSGQVSPSDTLDSGTCSDLDGTPPPLPKKKSSGVSVTMIGVQHKRAPSLTSSGAEADSDDNESNLSCDSLNLSGKISPVNEKVAPVVIKTEVKKSSSFLPQLLLQDIRQRNVSLSSNDTKKSAIIDEKSYEERKEEEKKLEELKLDENKKNFLYDTDRFYNFHINEHSVESKNISESVVVDETFAGIRNVLGEDAGTIKSAKGTVRGVKNRVRAGIATFLQINDTAAKNYKEKDAGKVVVYTTTMGILRETYQACMMVKNIMRTLLVKFEERDVFMSGEYQNEIKERMHSDAVLVPQVYVDGQHIGDSETIERLNESGELRKILKPYKSLDACNTCKMCGGFRLLPCQVCNGSKKSVHRNHFTAEFVALKCMNCDEVGLVRCTAC